MQVRLFMCYVATKPEKLDEARAEQWQKVRTVPTQNSPKIGDRLRLQRRTKKEKQDMRVPT